MSDTNQIIGSLIAKGKYEAAMTLHEQVGGDPKLLLRFLKFAFFNRSRSAIGTFVHKHFEKLPDPVDRAYALSKVITLAEMDGNLPVLSRALKQLDAIFEQFSEAKTIGSSDGFRLLLVALNTFMIRRAEEVIARAEQSDELAKMARQLGNYFYQCQQAGFDPYALDDATRRLITKEQIKVSRPTVVARITLRIWASLDNMTEESGLADGLQIAHQLLQQGHHVELAPQYSLPGPSIMAPYATEQDHPISFIDHHKYSTRSDIFIHCKPTHNGKMLIDRRGYSGWAEIQRSPALHRFRDVGLAEAQEYCRARREEDFGHLRDKPESYEAFARYGVIPLQMPGDSVQLLSRFTFFEMIDASIAFLHARRMRAVIRRHPLCRDPEVSAYLKSIRRRRGVHVVEENTRQLILHSRAVLLCNSSVGWDAILAHKPLFCFGQAEYSRAAYMVNDLPDLEEAPPLARLVSPRLADQFYFYYWQKYALTGRRATSSKLTRMVEETVGKPSAEQLQQIAPVSPLPLAG